MIIDHISNRAQYYYLGADFKAALDFFANVTDVILEKSDVPVENSGVLVKVRPMNTKPESECTFEAHKEYADIHFLAYGTEQIGYAHVSKLHEVSYDAAKDVALLEGAGDKLTLTPGYFMITLPQDAHMPCITPASPAPIGKMIAKIKV